MNNAECIASKQGIWLDVACGANKQPGTVGMDIRDLPGVDIIHDIRHLKWPFPDECCYRVLMSHIVEHISPNEVMGIIDEVWRVMKPEGQLLIATPYGMSPRALQDPTHYRGWTEVVPQYFDPSYELYKVYTPKPWKIEINEWSSVGDLNLVMSKMS